MPNIEGYVRSVTICEDLQVLIDIEPDGYDEGGIYYKGSYNTIDELISDIETYLNLPFKCWIDIDATQIYPAKTSAREQVSFERLQNMAENLQIELPLLGKFID